LGGKGKDGSIPYATTNYQEANIEIETNVDLREGQKVVIGTSNVEMASATLFLVVTARMVQ
jgi:positive regulator of sigma E activity